MPHSTKLKAKKAQNTLSPLKKGIVKAKNAQKALLSVVMYQMVKDGTLTREQARSGAFRPKIISSITSRKAIAKGGFRFASNPTKHGLSSGYHEAFVVTDMTDVLSRRTQASLTDSRMPTTPSGYWHQHSGITFPESNVEPMLRAGDTARTDTARTILSGPHGAVAGHSGSGVDTTGQSAAHDLLRDHAMRIIADRKLSARAIGVLAGSTALYSMAPGVLASTAKNAGSLKDSRAKTTWEDDRNESKERLAVAHTSLSPNEQQTVMTHMRQLAKDIGGSRALEPARPMSPRRERKGAALALIQGGGYDKHHSTTGSPTRHLAPGAGPGEMAAFITEPLRIQRQ